VTVPTKALGLLLIALAGAPLAACAPTPTALSAPHAGQVLDARDGGDAALTLTVTLLAGRRVQSAIRPHVDRLVLSINKKVDGVYSPLTIGGAPIEVEIGGAVTLKNLQRNTTYQFQVKAYSSDDPVNPISKTDDSSLSEVTIGEDETPETLALKVSLNDRFVTVAFNGGATPFDEDHLVWGSQPAGAPQSYAAVAYSESSNCYMVAWQDDRLNPTPSNIYTQVLAADGTARTAPTLLSDGVLAAGPPAIAYDAVRNQFLVVWASTETVDETTTTRLRARAVSIGGTAASAAFDVDAPPDGHTQAAPAVAFSAADNAFVVAWEDDRTPGMLNDVMARHIDAVTLTPGGTAISVDATIGQETRRVNPTLSGLPNGDVAVAWTDNAQEVQRLRYRRLGVQTSALVTVGPTQSLPTDSDQRHPSFAHDAATGQTLLVWDDNRDFIELGREVYGQLLASDLTPLGAERPMLETADATGQQQHPRVVFNANAEEYVLTWVDEAGAVFAGRRTSAGDGIGPKFEVASGDDSRDWVAVAHAGDPDTNSSLLIWRENFHLHKRVLDSRYAP
jgi:hypothetical protein